MASFIAGSQVGTAFSDIEIPEDLIRRFDVSGPRYTSYPTADRFTSDYGVSQYLKHLAIRAASVNAPPLSLYVHLPFCQSLCYFCACNKIITQDTSRFDQYLNLVERELALLDPHLGEHRSVSQLHLGGGTPTFGSDASLETLMALLRRHVEFADNAEISIEIDPRTISDSRLQALAQMGFNRTSFGVQDFDPDVQQAVNRIQPLEMVEAALASSRRHGFGSINMDLIYGLPCQSTTTFATTLEHVVRLRPDRIALYNYAHLPQRFKAQRLIQADLLPSADERMEIFLMALRTLLNAGYVYIGLDHFALPNDELSRAGHDGSLHRNFQGYTTRAECDLIGLGLSSIGKVGRAYTQTAHSLRDYHRLLDQDTLPVSRGIELTDDDVLRGEIIMAIMCSMVIDIPTIENAYNIRFRDYFSKEWQSLQPHVQAGLMHLDDNQLMITPKGRLFVRAIGMVFDNWLSQPTGSTYSRLI